MNDMEARENYFKCCNCDYCSQITLHTESPFLCVGCGKAGCYLYDGDECPIGKWNSGDD